MDVEIQTEIQGSLELKLDFVKSKSPERLDFVTQLQLSMKHKEIPFIS